MVCQVAWFRRSPNHLNAHSGVPANTREHRVARHTHQLHESARCRVVGRADAREAASPRRLASLRSSQVSVRSLRPFPFDASPTVRCSRYVWIHEEVVASFASCLRWCEEHPRRRANGVRLALFVATPTGSIV